LKAHLHLMFYFLYNNFAFKRIEKGTIYASFFQDYQKWHSILVYRGLYKQIIQLVITYEIKPGRGSKWY
jgi:hypothetical protein